MLALMLSACSTPPIINDCQPDTVLMQPVGNLKDIDPSHPMTEQDLIKQMLDDKAQYKVVQDQTNRLIDHVRTYCQNN